MMIKEGMGQQRECECGCGRSVRAGSRFVRGHNSRIDWGMITEGYNDLFGCALSTKRMLETLYGEQRNVVRMGDILGVYPYGVLKRLRLHGIEVQPPGHLRPTKMDRFMAIPEDKLDGMGDGEVATETGLAHRSVANYRCVRRKNNKTD